MPRTQLSLRLSPAVGMAPAVAPSPRPASVLSVASGAVASPRFVLVPTPDATPADVWMGAEAEATSALRKRRNDLHHIHDTTQQHYADSDSESCDVETMGLRRGTPRCRAAHVSAAPVVQIVGQLGAGGCGVVHHAKVYVEGTEHHVAIKSLKPDAPITVVQAHIREAAVLNRLAATPHPHVMPMHSTAAALPSAGAIPHIVMPIANSGELFSLIEAGTLDEPTIRRLFREIAEGLAHLHKLGLAHLDLTAENVLLHEDADGELHAVITDFGSTHECEADQVIRMNHPFIKPSYSAPEVHNGKAAQASDIFSLGVILFMLWAKYFPFNALYDATYSMIQAGELPRLVAAWRVAMPASVQNLVTAMLSETIEERPTIDEVLAHPWLA